MELSAAVFDEQFRRFTAAVAKSSGKPFISFSQGLAAQWESYKPALRDKALQAMDTTLWDAESIGTGQILERAIDAIELPDNNLVRWQNIYGHASRSHHALIEARLDKNSCRTIEAWLFAFYRGQLQPEEAFERFRLLAGNRYDLIAYMFFLRDIERFMPIATQTFDEAFGLLEIDVVTTQKCSWQNYQQYNDALTEVATALREQAGIADARLIDAHSFCWMLVRVERELFSPNPQSGPTNSAQSTKGRVLDAEEKWIWQMARNAEQAAKNSGLVVETITKQKHMRLSLLELKNHIDELMGRQERKCALTGIPLQIPGENSDSKLAPSLDRKDSSGHYEEGNLQVVCRFINFWKGSEDNEEFLRLLGLVRNDET